MSKPLLRDARLRREAGTETKRLKARAARLRDARRAQKDDLEARIVDIWGSALDGFEHAILEAEHVVRRVLDATSNRKLAINTRKAHVGLFGRSLLTASEVLELLRSGHGHGAYS